MALARPPGQLCSNRFAHGAKHDQQKRLGGPCLTGLACFAWLCIALASLAAFTRLLGLACLAAFALPSPAWLAFVLPLLPWVAWLDWLCLPLLGLGMAWLARLELSLGRSRTHIFYNIADSFIKNVIYYDPGLILNFLIY